MMAEEQKPSRLHPVAWVIVLAGFALIFFFAIVPGMRMKLYDTRFLDLKKGMTAEEVEKVMGEASGSFEARADLERFWGRDVQLDVGRRDIASVLTWRVSFGVKRFTWQVGFNDRGRAIAKSRFDG